MFNLLFSVFSLLFLVFSHPVSATPVKPAELSEDILTVTSPTIHSTWSCNSQQEVTWATNNIPTDLQSQTVDVWLKAITGWSGAILAQNVPVMDGEVQVTVPDNLPNSGSPFYFIYLTAGNTYGQSQLFAVVEA